MRFKREYVNEDVGLVIYAKKTMWDRLNSFHLDDHDEMYGERTLYGSFTEGKAYTVTQHFYVILDHVMSQPHYWEVFDDRDEPVHIPRGSYKFSLEPISQGRTEEDEDYAPTPIRQQRHVRPAYSAPAPAKKEPAGPPKSIGELIIAFFVGIFAALMLLGIGSVILSIFDKSTLKTVLTVGLMLSSLVFLIHCWRESYIGYRDYVKGTKPQTPKSEEKKKAA